MRFLRGVTLVASGALSLIAVVMLGPLVRAMRADRHARNERDADDRWCSPLYPYDDDDPGVDVDEEPTEDEIDSYHDEWHDYHGTRCDERPQCDAFVRAFRGEPQ